MKDEVKLSKRLEKMNARMKAEAKVIERQKNEFLEGILNTAKSEFENYEKGYKVFSIVHSHKNYYSLDDSMITKIINDLTSIYNCKLNGLAISQPPLSPKVYTLTFEK